jgi:hypothetical protein
MTILPSPSPSLVPDERAMPGADRHAVVGVYQTNRDREVGELLLVELGGGFVVDVGHMCTPGDGPRNSAGDGKNERPSELSPGTMRKILSTLCRRKCSLKRTETPTQSVRAFHSKT